jgi:hypothetical protein
VSSPNSYTTSTLVTNVQLVGHIPLSNSTFTSSEIINLANRELQTSLVAQILSVREGYYLTYVDYAITQDSEYPIPADAIGGAISGIQLVITPSVIPVNRIEQAEQFSTQVPTSNSYGFYIRGNTIIVMPVPSNGVIRVWYLRRPNALVATSAAAQITAIASTIITVSSLPSTFAVDTVVNLCQDQPTFDMLAERDISAINTLDVTLDAAVDDLAVGDWLCLQNQTPVPQIPVEFRPLLEQRVVVKIYELQGYLDKMKAAGDRLKQMEEDTFSLISPRVQTQTKMVNPQNGGFMNSNGRNASLFATRGQ